MDHFHRKSMSNQLAVWAVSLNFLHDFTLFVVDIHQIRLILLFRHFPDHFHFHGSAGLIPKVNLSLRHIISSSSTYLQLILKNFCCPVFKNLVTNFCLHKDFSHKFDVKHILFNPWDSARSWIQSLVVGLLILGPEKNFF